MKKYVLLSAISLLAISFLQAQNWDVSNKVVLGHSWTVGNKPASDKYKFNPHVQVGRSAVYNFNSTLGIGFGTYFSSEGVAVKSDEVAGIIQKRTTEMRSNYVRVPLFVNLNLGRPENHIRPQFSFGPSVGFLVGGKTILKNGQTDFFSGLKTTKALDTKIDAGINASFGLNIRVARGLWINHGINYYHGLVSNHYNIGTGSFANAGDFTNRSLGISLGMLVNGDAMRKWKNGMHNGKMIHHKKDKWGR